MRLPVRAVKRRPPTSPLSRLPVTLLPVSYDQQEFGDIVSDYEVDITSTVPQRVREQFEARNVELAIPVPHVFIGYDNTVGNYRYVVVEPQPSQEVVNLYATLISEIERLLLSNQDPDLAFILLSLHERKRDVKVFEAEAPKYQLTTDAKVAMYYVVRNVFGYGVLTPALSDYRVEDISCNGLGLPVYVYHRDYEYIPTNLSFKDGELFGAKYSGQEFLDQTLLRLTSVAGKTVSVAEPIVDAMLPNGDRLAATFGREVSKTGSSFVFRKFSESPITVLDLIRSSVISPELAAYLWYAVDLRMSFMTIGVTGAGKTTMLNAFLNVVKDSNKIVTIEDIPEMRLVQTNWVQLYSRQAFGGTGKEISLMDLLKLSLRYRPDMIVVGEIRGQEAYVLFQALSTGHGGATTLHARDAESAVNRLLNEPMNIPQEWIPEMNIVINVRRLPLSQEGRMVLRRRVVSIDEVLSYREFSKVSVWEPSNDTHSFDLKAAKVLLSRAEALGREFDEVTREIERRAQYLKLLTTVREVVQSRNSSRELKKYVIEYSLNPEAALRKVTSMAALSSTPR
ncbi:type II secretion system protein E [Sulfodiicoccus acidiphilus]|uniref:Type II secretion system protein E n=1 Tax=Sulfodiicoccus acidiphilus TaxID=1670455 RepID=A0A348B4F6_9CREN|nr:type II secretion system protein E [Sulfodiicoccus acidiphilus]GGU03957.1 type II secretion system protein E [Sulfodiicoccus acidiphilus]